MALTRATRQRSQVFQATRSSAAGVETKGQFALNDKWVWGWDGVLLSDYYFMSDYRLGLYRDPMGSFLTLPTEAISQLYLTGVGNRSYFDARTIYYLSFSGNQDQVPVVAPVIDYSNVINQNILGGEFSYKTNFTSLTRDTAAFDPTNAAALANGTCAPTSADTAVNITRANCLLRGMPGTYTRLTGEGRLAAGRSRIPGAKSGRRSRACGLTRSTRRLPTSRAFTNFLPTGETQALRVMPTVGLEYRYPLHQRAALGLHHGRADRAGHHPSERARCRQAPERRRPKPGIRHQQSVQRRQVLRL